MKKFSILTTAILLTACNSQAPTQTDTSINTPAKLPAFNSYTEAQNAVLTAFGMASFDPENVTSAPLKDGFGVIFGYGGNVLVSTGKDGNILVDNQFPEVYQALEREVVKLGGSNDGKVSYVINTHWHFDHAEGNRAFGPLGAQIIAHENSKKYMTGTHDINLVQIVYPQIPYPESALPSKTFTESMTLNLNDQEIMLYNFGPAHTTGDTIVYFKTANIVHMGDVGNFTPTPFIDADNGGTIDGVIKTVRETLKLINDETTVVPGHGQIGNKAKLTEFVVGLEKVRAQIAELKASGKTLEEVQLFYTEGEMAGTASPLLIDRAYMSIEP